MSHNCARIVKTEISESTHETQSQSAHFQQCCSSDHCPSLLQKVQNTILNDLALANGSMERCIQIQSRMAPLSETLENRASLLLRCIQRDTSNRQFADTRIACSKVSHLSQSLAQRYNQRSEQLLEMLTTLHELKTQEQTQSDIKTTKNNWATFRNQLQDFFRIQKTQKLRRSRKTEQSQSNNQEVSFSSQWEQVDEKYDIQMQENSSKISKNQEQDSNQEFGNIAPAQKLNNTPATRESLLKSSTLIKIISSPQVKLQLPTQEEIAPLRQESAIGHHIQQSVNDDEKQQQDSISSKNLQGLLTKNPLKRPRQDQDQQNYEKDIKLQNIKRACHLDEKQKFQEEKLSNMDATNGLYQASPKSQLSTKSNSTQSQQSICLTSTPTNNDITDSADLICHFQSQESLKLDFQTSLNQEKQARMEVHRIQESTHQQTTNSVKELVDSQNYQKGHPINSFQGQIENNRSAFHLSECGNELDQMLKEMESRNAKINATQSNKRNIQLQKPQSDEDSAFQVKDLREIAYQQIREQKQELKSTKPSAPQSADLFIEELQLQTQRHSASSQASENQCPNGGKRYSQITEKEMRALRPVINQIKTFENLFGLNFLVDEILCDVDNSQPLMQD